MRSSAAERYAGAGTEAIQHHYDVGEDFYRLWLDPSMTYSCALWADGEEADDLEAAQMRKLDYLIEGAGAGGARRVLDVGCGWGSGLRRLVDHHGVERAVGLTLSAAQARTIQALGDERCEARLENWTDHQPAEPYDAIISIGAFEHFARFGLTRSAKVESYRAFFMRCRELLRPEGIVALQTITKGDGRLDPQGIRDIRFVLTEIFPQSNAPWLAEVALGSERLFEVLSVRNDRLHYARTVREWGARLAARRDEAVAVAGEETTAAYERYLAVSERLFETGQAALLRIFLRRA